VARSHSPPEAINGIDHEPLQLAEGEIHQLAPGLAVGEPEILSPQPPLKRGLRNAGLGCCCLVARLGEQSRNRGF
jgi:hypothetical protein